MVDIIELCCDYISLYTKIPTLTHVGGASPSQWTQLSIGLAEVLRGVL